MSWIADKIHQVPIDGIREYENNPRTHSDHQVAVLVRAIEEFGFTTPVLMKSDGSLVAGHGRVMAARIVGLKKVPAIYVDHLSERQIRALVIADNKIASLGGWDISRLSEEISALADQEYDLSLTGMDEQELDAILKDDFDLLPDDFGQPQTIEVKAHERTVQPRTGLTDDDDTPDPVLQPVSRFGDVWILGDHRVMCGNGLDPEQVKALMLGKKADMVFTDPPYNVKISGIGSGNVNSVISRHGEFVMASGEMNEQQFTEFLRTAFRNLVENSKDGAIHYVCMDWRHVREVLSAADTYDGRTTLGEVNESGVEAARSLEQGPRRNGNVLPQ
jgi:hypothetical protein